MKDDVGQDSVREVVQEDRSESSRAHWYMYLILREWKELVGQLQDILFLELGFLPPCRLYPIPMLQNWKLFSSLSSSLSPSYLIVSTASDPRLVSVIAASLLLNTSRSSSTLLLNFDRA